MARLTAEEVVHIAKLSNLVLAKEEIAKFREQLSTVIEFVRKLQEVDTEGIIPTSQTTGLVNVLREDKTKPSFNIEDVFYSTDNRFNDLFKIGRLLEERGEK